VKMSLGAKWLASVVVYAALCVPVCVAACVAVCVAACVAVCVTVMVGSIVSRCHWKPNGWRLLQCVLQCVF